MHESRSFHSFKSHNMVSQRQYLNILQQTSASMEANVNAIPDAKRKITELGEKINSNLSPDVLNVQMLRTTVRDLEEESGQPGFWDAQEKAQKVLSEMNRVKALKELINGKVIMKSHKQC